MPAAGVPMPPIFGSGARDDDFVAFAGSDLVVAPGTAIRLLRFVRLDVAHVDAVVDLAVMIGPVVLAHSGTDGSERSAAVGDGQHVTASGDGLR